MKLFIDIETIPDQTPGAIDEIRKTIVHPGNITKPETIAKWREEHAENAAQEQYRKTALNGTQGEILCIGWAVDDDPAKVIYRRIDESESILLCQFYSMFTEDFDTIIGHNLIAFDLRFLFQRSVIKNVRPSFNLHNDTRYTSGLIYDTMTAWAGWGNRVSLKNLCAALGIEVKQGDITGATLWDAVQAGRYAEIAEYCCSDVEATRAVYKRMTWQT